MSPTKKRLIVCSLCFLMVYVLIDLKNIVSNGAPFVISDDLFDRMKFITTIPGFVLGFIVTQLIYRNIHNYDYWVMESVTLISSSLLYGWILSTIINRFKSKYGDSQ